MAAWLPWAGPILYRRRPLASALRAEDEPVLEEILFIPRTERGRDPIREPYVRPIAAIPDWRKQRKLWKAVSSHDATMVSG